MQGSQINPAILQQMLESATNAAEKGQSQFFTPLAFAHRLAQALPSSRPNICDLNCGAGHLLQASALPTTDLCLGNDIDPDRPKIEDLDDFLAALAGPRESTAKAAANRKSARPHHVNRLTCDLTRLYPWMAEINFQADLFVLNPPWRLWWDRERLKDLANSSLFAVRDAFANLEENAHRKGTVDGTIDSTIATLLIALDRCSYLGEGMLIANNATLERLLFTPGAPHAAVARHIWAHLVVPGNPMTGIDDCLWEKEDQFYTGVIYFARSHTVGPKKIVAAPRGRAEDWAALEIPDRVDRMGSEMCGDGDGRDDLKADWEALKERVAEAAGQAALNPYNLWLDVSQHIRCNLSVFQQKSTKLDKAEAARLYALRGKSPMSLVLQRAQRDELRHVLQQPDWKICPALLAAVDAAVAEYNSARAPLYPLPPIQRLGYLDEQDTIECKVDLLGLPRVAAARERGAHPKPKGQGTGQDPTPAPVLLFKAGEKYSLRTQTVNVTRVDYKPNSFTGEPEELEHSGQELAIYISNGVTDPSAKEQALMEYCFMDAKIRADQQTKVSTGKSVKYGGDDGVTIDFTLQQLADHFLIPEVPDVATTNPEGYRQHLDQLTALEQLTEALSA